MRRRKKGMMGLLMVAMIMVAVWNIMGAHTALTTTTLEKKDGNPQQQQQQQQQQQDHVHDSSATKTKISTKNKKKDILELCFVTAEFSEALETADALPRLDPDMLRDDPSRHFVFTNLEALPITKGWKKIVLKDLPYQRLITQSRWPKFLGWQHLALKHCQVIFYGDAYLLNPTNETVWQDMGHQILSSQVGLMQGRQMGSNHKPVKGPVVELWKNARIGKVSWEVANRTIWWLRNQSDYLGGQKTPVYKNALFGYDPHNTRFQQMTLEFWKEYSKEDGRSWRDQSYWAYFLSKYRMVPLPFTPIDPPPMGPSGAMGHNGHIYVVNSTTTTTGTRSG